MLIRLRFYGVIKSYMKKGWTTIDVDNGYSISDVIIELDKYTELNMVKKLLKNETSSGIKILLNGRNISHLQGLKTKLKDHDLITFLPIAGGG